MALLGNCCRTVKASFPKASRHWRRVKHAPLAVQTIGDRLRLARIDRGLKQAEVAEMLGVVYQTIERWEHNRKPITPKNQAKILAFLGGKTGKRTTGPAADSSS